MMKSLIAICLALLGGVALFVYSGFYDVGADKPHWPVTRKLIEMTRDRAIAVRANDIRVPDLHSEKMIVKGAGQYATMCAGCHLAPGISDSEIRPGLYPKPPNLSKRQLDPRTIFWVTKHGLKMSGMPAWGVGHDDATIWNIVAFVAKLPGMAPQQYKDIVAKAPPHEEMENLKNGGHAHDHDKDDSETMPAQDAKHNAKPSH